MRFALEPGKHSLAYNYFTLNGAFDVAETMQSTSHEGM